MKARDDYLAREREALRTRKAKKELVVEAEMTLNDLVPENTNEVMELLNQIILNQRALIQKLDNIKAIKWGV